MQSEHKILVGGENLIDFVEGQSLDDIPQYSANPGGSPFNVAIAAARQNADVDYLTPISTDRLGKLLASRLTESGVNLAAPRLDAPTSMAVVSLDQGQPSYQFYRDHTAERLTSWDDLSASLAAQPWAFHIGSLALAGGSDAQLWQDFFSACHDQGVITSLDPNVRPALIEDRDAYLPRLEAMFKIADVIKLSDEDIAWLYPQFDLMEAFDHLISISYEGLRVLTKGGEGAVAVSATGRIEMPAFPVVDLKDTVGAGDTFMASMLIWLRHHQKHDRADIATMSETDLTQMIDWARKAAALNCQEQGCNPPSREMIENV